MDDPFLVLVAGFFGVGTIICVLPVAEVWWHFGIRAVFRGTDEVMNLFAALVGLVITTALLYVICC